MRRLVHAFALVVAGCAATRPVAVAPSGGPRAGVAEEEALLAGAGVDPAALRCTRDNRWGDTIKPDAAAGAEDLLAQIAPRLRPLDEPDRAALRKSLEKTLMWRMVRAVILEGDNNNFGALPLRGRSVRDASGRERPVLVFRTGFTPAPDRPGSCVDSLLGAGGVRHVVNLFDGDIPAADLVDAEARAAAAHGASYHTATDAADAGGKPGSAGYGPWRDQLRKQYDDPAVRAAASAQVARLVREQILLPDGAPPRGNLHVHCGGGMHRTGMVVGVVEKCINGEPMEVVEGHYKAHVGWRDPEHKGGYEEGNVRFLREFDCRLLDTAVAQ